MADYKAILDKLFHPNRKKQEQLQDRMKELQELSRLALEIDNQQIYKNLQIESNQLFMKYLTLCFFDGLRFLVPHLFILALITTKIKSIALPGGEIGVLPVYLVGAILFHVLYKRHKKRILQLS